MLISEEQVGDSPAWRLENDVLCVWLARDGLDLKVTDKKSGKQWQMEPERRGFLIRKFGTQLEKPLSALRLLDSRRVREGQLAGVELMSRIDDPWLNFNVRVRVLLHETRRELVIAVKPHEDPGYNVETWIREIYYPRSFVHSASPGACTLIPLQSGSLLPGNWPHALSGEESMNLLRPWAWNSCTGPWWGHVDEGGAAYLAVMDTPDDAAYDFEHPEGGPTRIAPRWMTSFEAFRYERRVVYRFFPRGDHATLALAYKEHCRQAGRWRSIEEKCLEKPHLDKMRGAIGITQPVPDGTGVYNTPSVCALRVSLRGTQVERQFKTFDDIANIVQATVEENPDENIYFILSGWQTLGYDHAHPAACPPCPEAGGWEGMRRISRVAEEAGILFGVHDQYRDFFYSSPFWGKDLTLKTARRDSPRHSYWAGGTQSVLCPTLMLDFVKMNVQQLRDQKIRLNATYQDVLTAIPLEECYDHRHPATRADCRRARHSVLDYYRDLGWLITSESASDWAADVLDSFHVHAPAWITREGAGMFGIPVPLFSLAFHDCAILTSNRRMPPLQALLAGVNTFQPADDVLRRLHAETAYMPLSGHVMLSDDGLEQESVFGDSVRVRANLKTGEYRITGLPVTDELSGRMERGL